MEKYKCYLCNKKFNEIKLIFCHLRSVHTIKEKITQIKCVNNFIAFKCTKTFLTYAALRSHLEKCHLNGIQSELRVIIMENMNV